MTRPSRNHLVLLLALVAAGCSDSGAGPGAGSDVTLPDGTRFATLGEAVAAAAPSAVITVGEGEFAERLEITKPVTIRGAGPGTRILARTPSGRPSDDSAAVIIRNTSGLTLENLAVEGGVDTGILVRDAQDITLVNVTSTGNADHGLVIRNSSGVSVEGGRFAGNGDDGIRVRDAASEVTITGGEITDNAGTGIRVRESGPVSVTGNVVTGNDEYGIRVEDSDVTNAASLGTDNTLSGNARGNLRFD